MERSKTLTAKRTDRLKEPIDFNQPINIAWDRVNDCSDFARHAGAPHTDTKLLQTVQNLFQKTGVFTLCLKDFNDLPEAQQTMAMFKRLMTKVWKECHWDNRTNAGAGRHRPANTTTLMKEDEETATQAHVDALALQAHQDREHVSAAINALVRQAHANRNKVILLKDQVAALLEMVKKIPKNNNACPQGGGGNGGGARNRNSNSFC